MEHSEDLIPDWLVAGIYVEVLGDFQITSYNKSIGVSSRVVEMCQKEKEPEAEKIEETSEAESC